MKHTQYYKITFMLIVLILSTLLSFAFEQYSLRRENILLIYVASIMLIMIETKRFLYGLISTLVLVFVFNFFFTEPKYTFIIDDANYIITLGIFMIAIFILSTLTTSLQREIKQSANNEKKIDLLYQMSKDLILTSQKKEIIELVFKHLSMNVNRKMLFYFTKEQDIIGDLSVNPHDYSKEFEYAIDYQIVCGTNELKFDYLPFKIFPIVGKMDIKGALCIEEELVHLTKQEKEFIQTALLHMLTALERESITIHQEKTRFEMEKEKLKNTLLRSISHDLRTPLTTIQTGSSFLYDSFNQLDDDTKKSLLRDINNETSRLSEFVENVLNLTRLNANQLKLHYKNELIEDIFDDIFQRVKNRLEQHQLTFIKLDNDDFIHADIQLLIQVFINLIDNAIRHTKEDSLINVSYQKIDKGLIFEVKDNGGGILPHQIEDIFKDYVTFDYHRGDQARGIGLGLSICKSIVEAHNGYIKADNNEIGGTTFSFFIPFEEGKHHE